MASHPHNLVLRRRGEAAGDGKSKRRSNEFKQAANHRLPSMSKLAASPRPLAASSQEPEGPEVPVEIGDRVVVSGLYSGVLRFVGPVQFSYGIWCGVELDDPGLPPETYSCAHPFPTRFSVRVTELRAANFPSKLLTLPPHLAFHSASCYSSPCLTPNVSPHIPHLAREPVANLSKSVPSPCPSTLAPCMCKSGPA